MGQVLARKFGGRQEELAGARPWHEAEQRPAAPGAREHHVRDAPVHPREEHREHGATLSRRARRRQPCNGSVAVLDSHWYLALPLLISRDGPGSLPLSPNSKRERRSIHWLDYSFPGGGVARRRRARCTLGLGSAAIPRRW